MNNAYDPIKSTIASYNEAFEEFNKKTREVNTFPGLQEELDLLISLLKGNKVLDVGFGSGRDTLYFLRKGISTTSIELTWNFIYSLNRIIKSQICCMDMRYLGFANSSFDGLWVCASLLHIPKIYIQDTLDEFHRVLRKDGVLYVSVKGGQGEEWITEGHIEMPRYFTYYSMEELSDAIKNQKFKIMHTQEKPHQAGQRSWLSIYARKIDSDN
jgi:ubiquinone/menaquinone biosynthesis C-methylase UbiE